MQAAESPGDILSLDEVSTDARGWTNSAAAAIARGITVVGAGGTRA
jgi:hypothetical protein